MSGSFDVQVNITRDEQPVSVEFVGGFFNIPEFLGTSTLTSVSNCTPVKPNSCDGVPNVNTTNYQDRLRPIKIEQRLERDMTSGEDVSGSTSISLDCSQNISNGTDVCSSSPEGF